MIQTFEREFWGAHAARVQAMAARHRKLLAMDCQSFQERSLRRAAATSPPAAGAPQRRAVAQRLMTS